MRMVAGYAQLAVFHFNNSVFLKDMCLKWDFAHGMKCANFKSECHWRGSRTRVAPCGLRTFTHKHCNYGAPNEGPSTWPREGKHFPGLFMACWREWLVFYENRRQRP